jgi:hypothetical protein
MDNTIMTFNKKNGQIWTTDFVIGLLLFMLVVLITVKVAFTMYPSQKHIEVYRDAVHLSDALLSQGYPSNWTTSNVLIPGIAENNRINNTKLLAMTNLNYSTAKTLLHITSDYLFFIKNSTAIINTGQCVYGYNIGTDADCNPILTGLNYDDLVKIERLVIYNSTVVIMTVYTWD